MYDDVDDDTLREAAREALTRPSNSAMWDDRLYTTHAPTFSHAVNSDDLISESNYNVARDSITAWCDDDRDDTDVSDVQVIDARVSDWAVGPLDLLFVQVYEDDGVTFTRGWRAAVSLALAVREYPILDESDHGEREWAAFEEDFANALHHATVQHMDEDDVETEIVQRLRENPQGAEFFVGGEELCDWDVVEAAYTYHRDAVYTERGEEHARDWAERMAGRLTGAHSDTPLF